MGAALSFSVLGGSVPASLEVKILGFPWDQVVVLVGTRSPKAMMASLPWEPVQTSLCLLIFSLNNTSTTTVQILRQIRP